MRGWLRLVACLLGLTLATVTAGTGTAAADTPGRNPVILVHGWLGKPSDMQVMADNLQRAGYRTYLAEIPGQNNITNAYSIADLVAKVRRETGARHVDLVSHSMGGLSTRYYVKFLGGVDVVTNYVSFGTPQYGYQPACLVLLDDLGAQMCPSSSFLAALNAGDDTPGPVAYTSMWSSKDTPGAARLDGGACLHEIPGVDHAAEPTSPAFIDAVLSALAGHCPGQYVYLPIT
jgi:triacylglycerol lipase